MKTKRRLVIVLLAALILLSASIACSAVDNLPFIATPTPTKTNTPMPTSTPTSTPTPVFTPTATPLPDFSAVVLRLADLPAGFELAPNNPANTDVITFFSFMNVTNFQVLSGNSMLLISPTDQQEFDKTLNNPDTLMQSIGVASKAQVIPNMDNFGDVSNGFSAEVDLSGSMMQADLFIMKKGVVGNFVISLYGIGETPSMSIQEVAKILAERLDKISQ